MLSSILHREQARLYVKGVRDGQPEFELSPEEDEAISSALGRPPARQRPTPAASAQAPPGSRTVRVAFLGPEGTFSEEALLASLDQRSERSSRCRCRRSTTA